MHIATLVILSEAPTRFRYALFGDAEKFDSAYGSAQNDNVGAKSKPVRAPQADLVAIFCKKSRSPMRTTFLFSYDQLALRVLFCYFVSVAVEVAPSHATVAPRFSAMKRTGR